MPANPPASPVPVARHPTVSPATSMGRRINPSTPPSADATAKSNAVTIIHPGNISQISNARILTSQLHNTMDLLIGISIHQSHITMVMLIGIQMPHHNLHHRKPFQIPSRHPQIYLNIRNRYLRSPIIIPQITEINQPVHNHYTLTQNPVNYFLYLNPTNR